jgi:beta-mannosidase
MTFPSTTALDGTWQLLPIDSFRQGFYPLADDTWLEQQLPAHWQQHPLLERYAGKMVYRKRFNLDHRPPTTDHRPPTAEGSNGLRTTDYGQWTTDSTRYWLRLNGIFYWSQPYFNGVDLGRHEGYFGAQEYDVTPWVAAENNLLVEVDCPEEHDRFHKRLITGVFSHWDCLDPAANPGGIWLPVELIVTGLTRIKELLLDTKSIDDGTARLGFRAGLDAAAAGEVTLRWTVAPKNFAGEIQVIEQRRQLAAGAQELNGQIHIRDPQLWWTHDMGHPNCYTITLAVVQDGEVSDERATTFGIRRFELRNWIAYLNGVRFFIKGNNYAPGDTRIATMTAERYAEDMRLARECHMNMLRVHAHVEHPAFYEAADEAGLLLWQDFPLQWIYRREVLPEARRQARQMVRQLYNHPAVALWCMHNEPIFIADTTDERFLTQLRIGVSAFVWSWNRDVMDSRLKRDVEQEDRTRPAVRASGEYAVPLLRAGTDSHFYMGWYSTIYGPLRLWEPIARHFPNTIRFVTEFGAQSFPNLESCLKFMDADVTNIDWEYMTARHQFQPGILEHSLPWRSVRELEELVDLTQSYQAAVNRFYIDRLRFYKYRPTGGIIPFMFHDPNPAISFSIVDYWRTPKRAYAAMREAFSPQYLFTLIDKDHYTLGTPIDLPIYVVNDAHHDLPAELSARLTDPNGVELARIERSLRLPADCMAIEIERLRLTPDHPGAYRLALSLRDAEQDLVEHEYAVIVSPGPEPSGHIPTIMDRLKAEA